MKRIYHIEPLYEAFVWGGRKIIERYHIKTQLPNVGIMYHVIALPGKLDSLVEEAGMTLSEFYRARPELFCCKSRQFPVRMATSCGENKMSYHLHPSDSYAMEHVGTRGKISGSVAMEESDQVSEKLFGNRASSKEEFKRMVETEDWEHLFGRVRVKAGDFLNTPAGVIHGGGGEGKMAMTFSTNSDITYRFYDYGRNDPKRPLHLKEVYDCVNIPEVPLAPVRPKPVKEEGIVRYEYYDTPGEYTAMRLDVEGEGSFKREQFYFLFCASGQGEIKAEEGKAVPVTEGRTYFVPARMGRVFLEGRMRLYLISYRDEEAGEKSDMEEKTEEA